MQYKSVVGVSVLTVFPLSLGPGGLDRVAQILEKTSLSGVQLLPLRGMSVARLETFPKDYVISYENAWNAGTFYEALLRQLGLTGEENPTFLDYVLFGGKESSKKRFESIQSFFPNARYVVHEPDWKGEWLLEVSPEQGFKLEDYLSYRGEVVVDTWHLRRKGRNGYPPVTTAENRLNFIQSLVEAEKVGLVHFQTERNDGGEELSNYVAGKDTQLVEIVRTLGKAECPVIFEATPPIAFGYNFTKWVSWLERIADAIREDFES